MTTIQNTLLLDTAAWDLVLDSNGNIAVAGVPYSIAQDVASALRTFMGECWYSTGLGVPYWSNILGKLPPLQYVKTQMEKQALTIPNTVRAYVTFTQFSNRALQGQCLVTDVNDDQYTIAF